MAEDIRISELSNVSSLGNNDLIEVSQVNAQSETGYDSKKATLINVGDRVCNGIEYANALYTSNKKIIGAINELTTYIPVWNNTASGAIATFDTSLALPLQDCTIAIKAVQEEGTPTPSSPKLISGFTGANIHVADDETPHIIDNVTPITWQDEAGTVYGGSLDVTSGVLTVDRASDTINNLTTNYHSTGSVNYLYGSIANKYSTAIDDTEHPLMFEMLEYGGSKYASQFTDLKCYQTTGLNIYLVDNSCSSKSDFITKYGTARLVWYLATPVTYQLTPTQISAIVGTNNIFCDTGNTSVVYACSLKDYIDSQ